MNFEADGKEIKYKFGLTEDIIRAIKIAHDDNVDDCKDMALNFKGKDVIDTCKKLFYFLADNIKYSVDPEGVQWIRTPARLWQDREGDCKSYSLFCCCMLSALGIKNSFRFVDYGSGDYTHVYSIAYDEDDNEIIIDAVAYQCQNIDFNKEIKYKKHKDMKNKEKTQISFLSGLSTPSELMEDISFNKGDKANQNYLNTIIYYSGACENLGITNEITDRCLIYYITSDDIIPTWGDSVPKLQVAGYVIASHFDEFISLYKEYLKGNNMNIPYENIEKLNTKINEEIKKYTSNSNQKGEFVLTDSFKNANKSFLDWWNKYIINLNYNITSSDIPYNSEDIMENLNANCLAFLYCVCDESLLTSKALKKKKLQEYILDEYIAGSTISKETALIYISGCIMNNFSATANNLVEEIKKNKSKIGITYEQVESGLTTLSKSFADIWGAIKGNGTSTTSTTTVVPSHSDFSSSNNWLLYGGLIIAGLLIFNRNKK